MSKVYGIEDVIKLFDEVDKVATRSITKAAKSGATIVLKDARASAPSRTGAMRRGIKLKLEKSRTKGKKVYQVGFFGKDGKTGAEFVRMYGNNKRAFYPASQEYGWEAQGKRHDPPTKGFLRGAMDNNSTQVHTSILQVLGEELEKVR